MRRGKAPAGKWVPATAEWVPATAEWVPAAAEWVPAGQQATRQYSTTISAEIWSEHAATATNVATATNDATTAGNATTDDDATANDVTTIHNGPATRIRATVGYVTGRGRE